MDTAYRNALAYQDDIARKINSLRGELDKLQDEASRVSRFLKEWEDFAASGEHLENIPIDSRPEPVDKPKREPLGNPPKEDIAREARALIEVLGEPVSRNYLFKHLETTGYVIRGTDPKMVLSTTMWRLSKSDGEFVRLPKVGYWLRDRDYEPAGYKAHGTDTAERFEEHAVSVLGEALSVAEIAKEDEQV